MKILEQKWRLYPFMQWVARPLERRKWRLVVTDRNEGVEWRTIQFTLRLTGKICDWSLDIKRWR